MNKLKTLLLALGIGLGCTGIYWHFKNTTPQESTSQRIAIKKYDPQKHKPFILKQFKENWYWLINSKDYDVNYVLDTHSPNTYQPQYKGKMNIMVLEQDNVPVGFGTYFMLNTFLGKILFIEVAQEFRGKRFAEKLVTHAVEELKRCGANAIRLDTRVENTAARKLYHRLGFTEVSQDETFVHFRKEV